MLVRRPNKTKPIVNNQESDKVIIDGLMTTEDIIDIGRRAGENTIETLKRLYPKNAEYEMRELAAMNDESFTNAIRAVSDYNKEGIDLFYSNQKLKAKISETKNRLVTMQKEYEKTKEQNILYEQKREIERLTNELNEYKKANK